MGMYGWQKHREAVWRRLALVLLIVPLSAPFDEVWHRTFGKELVSSPLIVWSPPHIAIIAGIAASFLFLLPVLAKDKDITAQRFFGGLCLASAMSLIFFLTTPLEPTGPYHLLGFAGAGFLAAVIVGMLIVASRWIPGVHGATLVAIFFLLVQSVSISSKSLPELGVAPHDHPPRWLFLFATLIASAFVDTTIRRLPVWLVGTLAAGIWTVLIYYFSSPFFELPFRYSTTQMWSGILAGTTGGLLIGGLIGLYDVCSNRNKAH